MSRDEASAFVRSAREGEDWRVIPRAALGSPPPAFVSAHGLGIDVLACPCGKRMTFRATVFERDGLGRLLRAKGLPDRIEPIRPARARPQADLDFGA